MLKGMTRNIVKATAMRFQDAFTTYYTDTPPTRACSLGVVRPHRSALTRIPTTAAPSATTTYCDWIPVTSKAEITNNRKDRHRQIRQQQQRKLRASSYQQLQPPTV